MDNINQTNHSVCKFFVVKKEPLDIPWTDELALPKVDGLKKEILNNSDSGEQTVSQVCKFFVVKKEPLDIPWTDELALPKVCKFFVVKEEPLDIPWADELAVPKVDGLKKEILNNLDLGEQTVPQVLSSTNM